MDEKPPKIKANRRHLIVWGAAFAIYFIFVFRFLRILALDFEALVNVLFQVFQLTNDWAPWGRFFIQFGSGPLFIIFFAALLYRLFGPYLDLDNPLSSLPRKARAALFFFVYNLFLAFCIPFSVGLSIMISVEAFWWIQWYQNVFPTMAYIRFFVPLLTLPGAAFTGFLLLRFSFARAKKEKEKPGFFLQAGRVIYIGAAGLSIAAFSPKSMSPRVLLW